MPPKRTARRRRRESTSSEEEDDDGIEEEPLVISNWRTEIEWSEEYNDPAADLVILSRDLVGFRVRRSSLALGSRLISRLPGKSKSLPPRPPSPQLTRPVTPEPIDHDRTIDVKLRAACEEEKQAWDLAQAEWIKAQLEWINAQPVLHLPSDHHITMLFLKLCLPDTQISVDDLSQLERHELYGLATSLKCKDLKSQLEDLAIVAPPWETLLSATKDHQVGKARIALMRFGEVFPRTTRWTRGSARAVFSELDYAWREEIVRVCVLVSWATGGYIYGDMWREVAEGIFRMKKRVTRRV